MEQIYAIIENGVCVNAIVAEQDVAAGIGAVFCPEGFGIGDLCDGVTWTKKPPAPEDVESARAAVKEAVGEACQQAIYAGVDAETSQGVEHFSLEDHDQLEIIAQKAALESGAAAVPYHADGELCRMWSREDFTVIVMAATAHIFYHRTYCNHLNAWISRAGPEELAGIYYGAELPFDLAQNMAALIAAAQA